MDVAESSQSAVGPPLLRLQRLAQQKRTSAQPLERCELCAAKIHPEHEHLLEMANRQLICACEACAILFSGAEKQRYRRVPGRVVRLDDLNLSDGLWESLGIPINLVFFYRSSAHEDKIIAMYPSPAGATESALPMDAWQEIEAASPLIQKMQPDIEALLINHVRPRRDQFLVSIDQCYKLVGLIRTKWHGLSGGKEAWQAVSSFFDELHHRCDMRKSGGASRA